MESMTMIKRTTISILLLLMAMGKLSGQPEKIVPFRAVSKPTIDGQLNDDIWQREPTVKEHFISYFPYQGEKLPFLTEVWAAYDEYNLYFAFYAHDNEPNRIKTSITKRDNIIPEDWVGVMVNTAGNRQNGYGFYSNPSGIQYDELVSSSGEDFDPDWVWYSNAQIQKDGYTVEIHIPLKNIVYQSGKNVKMCLTFFRKISRLGYVSAWPTINAGSNSLRASADAVYPELKTRMRLEVLPAVTYSSQWERKTPQNWLAADDQVELGLDINVGLTSAIMASMTANPDFSQVESDTFQVLVNQRFPVFFEEKRPFFMELSNRFNLARSSASSMETALHTRKIVNPDWGFKTTGELGKLTFGLLASQDNYLNGDTGDNIHLKPVFLAGRVKLGLNGDNYIGLLLNSKESGGDYNRVLAGDFLFNFNEKHTFKGNMIYSTTGTGELSRNSGMAYHLNYIYLTKFFEFDFMAEHFDRDFRMDIAFYERVGMTKYRWYLGPVFYPGKKINWIKRIIPTLYLVFLEDAETGLNEFLFRTYIYFDFPSQGSLFVKYFNFKEIWQNRNFTGHYFEANGSIQATKWLNISAYARIGDGVLYDQFNPMVGDSRMFRFSTEVHFSQKLSQFFQYIYQDLSDPATDELIYDVNVLTSRTTFQINKYLFFRGTAQYDSSRDLLLTDFLVSFTLIPGTVIHLGYGSLYQDLYWNSGEWMGNHPLGKLYQINRSLFFKASYRWGVKKR